MEDTSKNRKRIFYLDIARAFAIISITCNHAVNRAYDNYTNPMRELVLLSPWANLLKAGVSVFSRIGVPLFLMITGVLILNKRMEEEHVLKHYYKHNVLSLFITTEIWYFIMYWFIVLLDPVNRILEDEGFGGALVHMIQTMCLQNQVTMGSMWYMPMILSIYLTLPLVCVAKNRLPSWVLWIPMAVSFVTCFAIPSWNAQMSMSGGEVLYSNVQESYIFSAYYLYILLGYFLARGLLNKLRTWQVALGTVGIFLLNTLYQVYAYSKPSNYLISYYSVGILLCSVFTFELIRRSESVFQWCRKAICCLSRNAFAIYFLHILIMSLLVWYADLQMRNSLKLLLLEGVSFAGSLVIIWLTGKIPFCKKYLYMIKS